VLVATIVRIAAHALVCRGPRLDAALACSCNRCSGAEHLDLRSFSSKLRLKAIGVVGHTVMVGIL